VHEKDMGPAMLPTPREVLRPAGLYRITGRAQVAVLCHALLKALLARESVGPNPTDRLVRYERLHRFYEALSMLAAAIITLRRIPVKINIIYE
jgi:hypothetical protein